MPSTFRSRISNTLRVPFIAVITLCTALGASPSQIFAQSASVGVQADAPAASVTGFRSAKFGMSEDEVREAIETDFGLEGDEISVGTNSVERTRVMTIKAPEVLPEGGVAQISYIFGYQSKALIQVGVLWSPATDPATTDATLFANGDVLRAFFDGAGYQPDTISRDVVLDNGVLLFRGSDASGHTTILILQGRFEETDTQRRLFPDSLTLLYAVDPDEPDIFQVNSGDF